MSGNGSTPEKASIFGSAHVYGWPAALKVSTTRSLYSPDGLRSERIFAFLCSLPRKFSCSDPRAKQPIFVGFGLSYDIAQILAGLPKLELWEVRKGKPWMKRNDPTWRANYEGWVLWRGYAVAVLPGKKRSRPSMWCNFRVYLRLSLVRLPWV